MKCNHDIKKLIPLEKFNFNRAKRRQLKKLGVVGQCGKCGEFLVKNKANK